MSNYFKMNGSIKIEGRLELKILFLSGKNIQIYNIISVMKSL